MTARGQTARVALSCAARVLNNKGETIMPFQLDPTFAQDPAKHFDTLQIHAGLAPDPVTGAAALPIYASAAFQFDSAEDGAAKFALAKPGNVYGRLTNTTTDAVADRKSVV